MQRLTLLNRAIKTNKGSFGILRSKENTWFTVERPWVENQNNVSCIPTGVYTCKWTLSPRLKKYTYEVLNVKGRAGIRIHSANFPEQLLGCIALGETMGIMDGRRGVFSSVSAVRRFNAELNKEDFLLEVK